MRLLLLVNEGSGSGSGPSGADLERMLRAEGARVERLPLDGAARAAELGVDRLVVAGGDGSVAPAADAAGDAGIPLAVIPRGTANDFARRMGIPDDPGRAVRLAAGGGVLRSLDLGLVGERPFVNVASAGLSVVAARRAEGLKRLLGPAAYAVGAVRAALTSTPLRCAVRCDGEPLHEGAAWQVMVACTGAFGGGSQIEVADPGDGRLDVVVATAGSRAALARYAYGLRSGRIARQRGVRTGRAREVELGLAPGAALNVDGEIVEGGPRLGVRPARYRLVVS